MEEGRQTGVTHSTTSVSAFGAISNTTLKPRGPH